MTRHCDRSLLRKVRRATDGTTDRTRTAAAKRATITRTIARAVKGGR